MSEVVAADQLRLFIERIERLEEEKKGVADDIKDVYAEAKANGYDVKTMRAVVALRKLENHVRQEAEALLHTYKAALGMDDLFAGHDGRAQAEPESDPVMESARGKASRSAKSAIGNYAKHLDEMDKKGIGISMGVPGGKMVPLNETARKAKATKDSADAAEAVH